MVILMKAKRKWKNLIVCETSILAISGREQFQSSITHNTATIIIIKDRKSKIFSHCSISSWLIYLKFF